MTNSNRKCGEITFCTQVGKRVYVLNCIYCSQICLQWEMFINHLEQEHDGHLNLEPIVQPQTSKMSIKMEVPEMITDEPTSTPVHNNKKRKTLDESLPSSAFDDPLESENSASEMCYESSIKIEQEEFETEENSSEDNTQIKTDDNALLDLLNKWNLEHLYNHLNAHRITTKVLKVLKPDHIKTLFHGRAVGDQALFEIKLESWKENCDDMVIILPKPNVSENRQHCSILNVLKSTKYGKSILEYYEKNKILHEEQRHLLIKTIASYVESKDMPSSISDCLEMEKQIYSIFPTEKPEYYNIGKRGKLYSKIYSLKRNSKCLLQPKKVVTEDCNQKYVVEAEAETAVENLRQSGISCDEFDFYWRKCLPYRFQQIRECKSITEILKEWPEYTKSSGFKLIDIDFKLKFPDAKDMIARCSSLEDKILHVLTIKICNSFGSQQLKNIATYTPETKVFGIFWNLHYLFPPLQRVVVEEGVKIRKKFAVSDSQESFAIICNTHQELDIKLNLLKIQKCHKQPRLLVIGNISDVKEIYVYFNDIKFLMNNVLSAIDVLFKTFLVFNLDFPKESEVFYNFLQIFFYEMDSDKKFTKTYSIKNEILNLKLP